MSPSTLDARLIRFRSQPGAEPPAPFAEELLREGRGKDAVEVAAIGLTLTPNDPRLLWLEGSGWILAGDLERAQASLVAAGKLAPRSKEVFKSLGEVLLRRNDFDRALKVIERALSLDGADAATNALLERAKRRMPFVEPSQAAAAPQADADDDEPEDLEGEATVARVAPSAMAAMMSPSPKPAPKPASLRPQAPAWSDDDAATNAFTQESLAAMALPKPPSTPKPSTPPRPAPSVAPRAVPAPASDFDDSDATSAQVRPEHLAAKVGAVAKKTMLGMGAAPPPPRSIAPPSKLPPPPVRPRPASAAPPPSPSTLAGMPSPKLSTSTLQGMPSPEPTMDDLFANVGSGERPSTLDQFAEKSGAIPLEQIIAEERAREAEQRVAATGNTGKVSAADTTGAIFQRRARAAKLKRAAIIVASSLVGLGALGAGGYVYLRAQKMQEARAELARAWAEALRGDVESATEAETIVGRSRSISQDLDADEGVEAIFLASVERALEGGAFDVDALADQLARFDASSRISAQRKAAIKMLRAARTQTPAAQELTALGRGDDAVAAYVAGRLGQRIGLDSAREILAHAVAVDGNVVVAQLALADAEADELGDEVALARVDRVLANREGHVRATIYKAYFASDGAAALAALTTLASAIENVPPADKLTAALARARAHHKAGNAAEVASAVAAVRAIEGVTDGRLLARAARDMLRLGALDDAKTFATRALADVSPQPVWQRLLVEIELARWDAEAATAALAPLDADSPDTLALFVRAALLRNTPDALADAQRRVATFVAAHSDAGPSVRALGVRLRARTGDRAALAEARTFMSSAPSDPAVLAALGEAALRSRDAATASDALSALTRTRADDPDANYMLGLARRAAGDADGATRAFRHALLVSPLFAAANVGLLQTLIDAGLFAEAKSVAEPLVDRGEIVDGLPLGAHAKIAIALAAAATGDATLARTTLDSLPAAQRDSVTGRIARARTLVADRRFAEVPALLRPLADSTPTSTAEVWSLLGDALYGAGQVDAAANAYLTAITRTADYPDAWLGRAKVFFRAGRPEDTVGAVERLQASLIRHVRPASMRSNAFVLLGQAKQLERDAAGARDAFSRAAAIEGASPESFFFFGESLSATDAVRARAAYERYLELAPNGEFAVRARQALTPR